MDIERIFTNKKTKLFKAKQKNSKLMNPSEYISKFLGLIEFERLSEIEFHTNEIKVLTGNQREKKGRTILNLKRQENNRLESDMIFRFTKNEGNKFFPNEITIGSSVLVSEDIKNNNILENSLKGTVFSKSEVHIDVQLQNQSEILNKTIRIDLFVNDVTYQNQKEIIRTMKDWTFEKRNIRDILLFQKKPELEKIPNILIDSNNKLDFLDKTLNETQKLAVEYSLKEKEFYLIQGPPGTGKTKTSIEIIRQHLKLKKKILVCADSNMAVDNIMLGLLKHIDVIRIGESPKIMDEIQNHTLSKIVEKDIRFSMVQFGLDKMKKLREKQRNCIAPNKKNAKDLSYFQIQKHSERKEGAFGISYEKMKSMAEWIKAQLEIKETDANINKIKNKIISEKLKNASVICTTNSNAKSIFLDKIDFDLVLIDEAAQSTEPSCLIPISKGKKVILVGDHKQLPPTILSDKAKDLSVSMFERMMGNSRYILLDTQYRMHPNINDFASKEFYDGRIKSDESTKTHELKDKIFEKNIIFIESIGKEEKHKGATSYFNNNEIDIVFDLVGKYAKKGMTKDDMGIISPYNEQVKKIKDRMPFVEVNSIDGFQGREKNIIIISLVRSNEKAEIGFLKDLRRLNVALTRAINELVVIGNKETIKNEVAYQNFIDYVKKNGIYIKKYDIS